MTLSYYSSFSYPGSTSFLFTYDGTEITNISYSYVYNTTLTTVCFGLENTFPVLYVYLIAGAGGFILALIIICCIFYHCRKKQSKPIQTEQR